MLQGPSLVARPKKLLLLATQTVLLNDLAIALDVDVSSVVEHSTSTADQHQEATTTVVVLLVALQVLGQLVDPCREQCDLHFRGTSVAVVHLVRVDRVLFGHSMPSLGWRSRSDSNEPVRITPEVEPQRTRQA